MVEGLLVSIMETAYPELIWSENYYEAEDNTGTVYLEASEPPSKYEDDLRFPYYMVWIRSSSFDLAEKVSLDTITLLNKRRQITYTNHRGEEYFIYFIESTSDAVPIGKNGKVMEWSSNFKVTLRRIK